MSDHLCRLLYLGVGTVAPLLWLLDPSASGVLGLVLALLILGRICLDDLRQRVFVRRFRWRRRLEHAGTLLMVGGILAAIPDAWLGRLGSGSSAVSWATVGNAVAFLVPTAYGCLKDWSNRPDSRGPLSRKLQSHDLKSVMRVRFLMGFGRFPVLLAVTHPNAARDLLLAAVVVMVTELAFSWSAIRSGDWQLRVTNAVLLPLIPGFRVPWVHAHIGKLWVYESVTRRPRSPDLAAWELMLRHDEVLAHVPLYHGVVSYWQHMDNLPTADAEPWVSAAEAYSGALADLFRYPGITHRYPAVTKIPAHEFRRLFTIWQTVEAMTAMARAEASVVTGVLDNAVRNRRYAARLFDAAGLPLNAAAARCLAADTLVFDLARPGEALGEVAGMGDRTALPLALQRLAGLVETAAGLATPRSDDLTALPEGPGSANALFEELPTWLPFLSNHHRAMTFVGHVEQRIDNVTHLLNSRPRPDFSSNHWVFRRYEIPFDQALRQALGTAQAAYGRGSLQQARRLATTVLEAARSTNDLPQQMAAQRLLARLAASSGEWSEQFTHLIALVATIETARGRIADGDLRIDLDLAQPCAELVALIVDRRIPGAPLTMALDMAERGRARFMLQTLGGIHEARLPAKLRELQREEAELLLRVRGGDDRASFSSPFEFENLNPYWGQRARAELENIWRAMEATGEAGAAYVSDRRGAPAEYTQLRDLLRAGEVLCEFVRVEARTLVLLVRSDRPDPVVVDLRLRAESLTPKKPDIGQPAPHWITELEPLAEALTKHTSPGDVLWMVPDGLLHDIPLHAVTVAGAPLGERNPMSCTPSASLMRYRLDPVGRNESRTALVLADSRLDLPHARAEARAIRAILPAAELHLGASATREAVRGWLTQARYDVVHLACHCRLDPEQPSKSGILLADGQLTAEDLLKVRLDVRLVVLSGCETGVQELRRGNELMGLTRQFLLAGARSVVVTRWQVDDISTALLMDNFYQRLKEGSPVATALSAARHRLRSMSLAEALEHCEGERERTADPDAVHSLSHDIARLRLRAGDVTGAQEEIDVLLADAAERSPYRRQLLVLRDRARYTSTRSDHHLPAFDHPYYWAPFTLVGDWR